MIIRIRKFLGRTVVRISERLKNSIRYLRKQSFWWIHSFGRSDYTIVFIIISIVIIISFHFYTNLTSLNRLFHFRRKATHRSNHPAIIIMVISHYLCEGYNWQFLIPFSLSDLSQAEGLLFYTFPYVYVYFTKSLATHIISKEFLGHTFTSYTIF